MTSSRYYEERLKGLKKFQIDFIEFLLKEGGIKLGKFTLKSGRQSPYFVDIGGVLTTGSNLETLIQFYKEALENATLWKDLISGRGSQPVLLGPPYKGITLASALAQALDKDAHPTSFAILESSVSGTPFMYHRKEVKDHGEGGLFVGYPFFKNDFPAPIILIDDVLTAGTAVQRSLDVVYSEGLKSWPSGDKNKSDFVKGLLIAIDRQECAAATDLLAAAFLRQKFNLQVISIIQLDDLIAYLISFSQSKAAVLKEPWAQKVFSWLSNENGLERILAYRSMTSCTNVNY